MSISPINDATCGLMTDENRMRVKVVKAVEDEVEVVSKKQDYSGEDLYEILIEGRRLTSMGPAFEVFSFTGAEKIIFEPEGSVFIKITIKKSKEEQVLYADKNQGKAYTHLPNSITAQEAKAEFIKEAERKFVEETKKHEALEPIIKVFNRHGIAILCYAPRDPLVFRSKYSLYWASSIEKFEEVNHPLCDCKETKMRRIDYSRSREGYRSFPTVLRPAYSLTISTKDVRLEFTRDKVTDVTKKPVEEAKLNGEPAEIISLQRDFQVKFEKNLKKDPSHIIRNLLKI